MRVGDSGGVWMGWGSGGVDGGGGLDRNEGCQTHPPTHSASSGGGGGGLTSSHLAAVHNNGDTHLEIVSLVISLDICRIQQSFVCMLARK